MKGKRDLDYCSVCLLGEQNDWSVLAIGPMHMKEVATSVPAAQAVPVGVASASPRLGMYVWMMCGSYLAMRGQGGAGGSWSGAAFRHSVFTRREASLGVTRA